MTTTTDPAGFRAVFPAFREETKYPSSQIQFYLDLGAKMFAPDRWADQLQFGQFLWVAHNLVLDQRDVDAEDAGGSAGTGPGGPIASKTIERLSISYDTGAANLENAGEYALTSYGRRLLRLIRIVGIGGLQSAPGQNNGIASLFAGGGAFQF